MKKRQLKPVTTLYPVPVVLITCGANEAVNVFSLNRIASCNAEPPMISISVRPARASHDLIDQSHLTNPVPPTSYRLNHQLSVLFKGKP
jgi:flavin reductase (DIM6/NTAB) family NADH-FMN oxidoreductase RutF